MFLHDRSLRTTLLDSDKVLMLPALICLCCSIALAQRSIPTDLPRNSGFAQIDFAQLSANQEAWEDAEQHNGKIRDQQELVDSGAVSIYDLQAPSKAIREFNKGAALLKAQSSKQAIPFLEKAIHIYTQFVTAHIGLGLAYFDLHDDRAHDEFKTAATLDSQFPSAFFDLGVTEIASQDYAAAASHLQKAVDLEPDKTTFLRALADAQLGAQRYGDSLRTAERVHQLGDRGMANIHYIAASDAVNLQDMETCRRELTTFLAEDPTNPLAPLARKHLRELEQIPRTPQNFETPHSPITVYETFPNSDRLHDQLGALTGEDTPTTAPHPAQVASNSFIGDGPLYHLAPHRTDNLFTIRQAVDETALFVSISQKGHIVNDLSAANIQILDNELPPERILQFTPQSELPLRLGLLIDVSASVEHRFAFEKRAASKFLERVLNPQADLAFVAGFSNSVSVTQDFTADLQALTKGIDRLHGGDDGTSVFDSVEFACRKLAAYPDQGRVARVLVILTDGQDNSSHTSLMQSIEAAEDSGVTVYTVNTADDYGMPTDAARILQSMADRSGGEFLFPKSLRDLDKQLAQLPGLIRSRYLIAYKPANFKPNGKFRSLRVSVNKDGKELKVHARKGYFARLAENR